ncbi:hypothetical protein V2G26_021419 [Clonostachys chloroleuca]
MRALVLNTVEKSTTVQDVPNPEPGPKEILVGKDLVGFDDLRTKVGARVSGFVQGASSVNDHPGAFAAYVAIDYDLTWNIPDKVSFEEAASVSLGAVTATQGVFERLQLPSPFSETGVSGQRSIRENEPVSVFIYGASSSVGLYAAQLVRLSEKGLWKKNSINWCGKPLKACTSWPEAVPKATGGEGVQSGGKLAIFGLQLPATLTSLSSRQNLSLGQSGNLSASQSNIMVVDLTRTSLTYHQ